jgi:hypothetical protein
MGCATTGKTSLQGMGAEEHVHVMVFPTQRGKKKKKKRKRD